jgi:hypothetical protein
MLLKNVRRLRGLIADMSVGEIADHVQFSYEDTEIRTETDYERASRLIPEVHKPWLDSWRQAALDALDAIVHDVAKDYILRPKDADGKVIDHGHKTTYGEVDYIRHSSRGWEVVISEGPCAGIYSPYFCHHAEPTVEDVLDEFASAYDRIGGEDDEHQKYLNLVSEYAKKLRLAGETA